MILLSKILLIITFWISINSMLYFIIEKITKYNGNTQGDMTSNSLIGLIFLLGPIMFLFIKQIKTYRKHYYLKQRIEYYSLAWNTINRSSGGPMNPEIKRLERIYKISLIHQKSKRNKFKKIFS